MLRKGTQIFFVCIVENGRKERSSCRKAKQRLHRLHDNSRRTFQAEKQKKTFLDCETEDKQLKLKRQRTEKWQKRHSEGRTLGQVMASHPWIQKKEMNKLGQMIISVFHKKFIWPPVQALSKSKRHLLDLTLWTTVLSPPPNLVCLVNWPAKAAKHTEI